MKYFYYRIFKALLNKEKNNNPSMHALVMLVTLQGLNVYSILDVFNYYFKLELYKQLPLIAGFFLYVILLIPNYLYIVPNHNDIMKHYQNETKEDKTWGIIGLLIYIVFSFLIFFVLGRL